MRFEPLAGPSPLRPNRLRCLSRTMLSRLTGHLIDLLTHASPLALHSRSGFVVPIRNRTERRIFERMFIEDMFPLAGQAGRGEGWSPTVADIGAHVGLFSLHVADWFPRARIHLFEPVPALAQRATELARINGLDGLWSVHQAVIGNRAGEQDLHCPRSALGASVLRDKAAALGGCRRTLRVATVRLDDHAIRHGLAGFDIIKIDTEGVEYDAIASALRVLAQARIVFVRVFPPRTTRDGISALLAPLGLVAVPGTAPHTDEHLWIRG